MPGKRRRDEYRGNGKEPMETSAASHDTRKHVLEAAERRQADSAFARLLGDTTKADVTISVDGEHFPAHRCVLAARSPFFRGILEAEGVHRGRQLLSADVSAGAFRVLLRHLYTRALPDAEDCGEGLAIGEMVRVAHDLGTTEVKQSKPQGRRGQYASLRVCCAQCTHGTMHGAYTRASSHTHAFTQLYEHCLGVFRASLRPDNVIRRLILADVCVLPIFVFVRAGGRRATALASSRPYPTHSDRTNCNPITGRFCPAMLACGRLRVHYSLVQRVHATNS